jgi:HD-GYP domain-containing protein (c-di-GMP phosphodiesterase class II)
MNRLSGDQLRVGEPIPFDCYDGQGRLLLKKGLVIDTQRQIDFLLERGLFGMGLPGQTVSDTAIADKPASPFQLLNEIHNRLKQLLGSCQESPASGNFGERTLQLATDIQKLCRNDADAILGAVHLDTAGRYSIQHPLYRAVVCELLARRKDIADTDRLPLIAAALTCDLAMIELQDTLMAQGGPLTPEQQRTVTAHPEQSAHQLSILGVTDTRWLEAVRQHHELLNGKGYPYGLTDQDITPFARILKLADMYTAMICPKAYRKMHISKTAMRSIFVMRGNEIDGELAVLLVKELGVYPPGAFVKLQSGELAIVLRRGQNPKAPAVKAVVGPRGAPFDRPFPRATDTRDYEILDVVERDRIVAIDLHKLWGYDA